MLAEFLGCKVKIRVTMKPYNKKGGWMKPIVLEELYGTGYESLEAIEKKVEESEEIVYAEPVFYIEEFYDEEDEEWVREYDGGHPDQWYVKGRGWEFGVNKLLPKLRDREYEAPNTIKGLEMHYRARVKTIFQPTDYYEVSGNSFKEIYNNLLDKLGDAHGVILKETKEKIEKYYVKNKISEDALYSETLEEVVSRSYTHEEPKGVYVMYKGEPHNIKAQEQNGETLLRMWPSPKWELDGMVKRDTYTLDPETYEILEVKKRR